LSERNASDFNGCRLQPVAAPTRSRPTGWTTVCPVLVQSVQSFLRETAEEVGADEHTFKLLKSSWSAWAREHGLQPVSDKALGQALLRAGCRKRKVDRRKSGQGYLVFYSIPEVAA